MKLSHSEKKRVLKLLEDLEAFLSESEPWIILKQILLRFLQFMSGILRHNEFDEKQFQYLQVLMNQDETLLK